MNAEAFKAFLTYAYDQYYEWKPLVRIFEQDLKGDLIDAFRGWNEKIETEAGDHVRLLERVGLIKTFDYGTVGIIGPPDATAGEAPDPSYVLTPKGHEYVKELTTALSPVKP